jgi:hypothetical protein
VYKWTQGPSGIIDQFAEALQKKKKYFSIFSEYAARALNTNYLGEFEFTWVNNLV